MARSKRKKKAAVKRELDPSKFTHVVFAVLGFCLAWVLSHFIEDVWATVWSYWPQIGRADEFWSNIAGIGTAFVATVICWRNQRYFKFVTEVVVEISQVTWPTRSETRAATVVVVVITLICSGLLAGMDWFWSAVTDWLYGI